MSKTNNIAKQALLEMDEIKKSIKEESKETLKTILSEAVKNAIRESVDDDKDEDEYTVEDEEKDTKSEGKKSSGNVSEVGEEDLEQPAQNQEQPTADAASAEAPVDGEQAPADDSWDNYSQYQTGEENTYDLTNVKDYNEIVKVYKLMKDSDQVVVKKDGEQLSLVDNETGNEYVIDLGMDGDDAIEGESEDMEMSESVIREKSNDIAGIPSDSDEFEDNEIEFDVDDSDDNLELDDEDEDVNENKKPRFEGKKGKKIMKENKEMLFEIDLGYTDNYQDKDPIQGLSNAEPSKSGKSWEKGVPMGTEKPWAGNSKDKGDPFEDTVNEEVDECGTMPEETVDEAAMSRSRQADRKETKSNKPSNAELPKVSKNVSVAGDYKAIAEAYQKENKELKKCVKELRKSLSETYVVNANLAKITRLFTENTVSQDERKEIVNRFANEAKTLEQSKALYESIDRELKKNTKNITLESSKPMSVNESKSSESNVTYKSQDLLNTLDLIKRIENC